MSISIMIIMKISAISNETMASIINGVSIIEIIIINNHQLIINIEIMAMASA
jgi:hypothetical protein